MTAIFALRVALAAALFFPAFLPGSGEAQDPQRILERAAAELAELRSLCADFRQEIRIPLLGQSRESRGRLCQEPPNLFSMHFSDPSGDRIVADGSWLWTYYPSTDDRQVIRFSLEQQGRMDFFSEFVADPGVRYTPRYEGEERLAAGAAHRIALTPRSSGAFRSARVWIHRDTHLLVKVEITQENESVRVVELDNLRLNAAVPSGTFAFTPPPGVQVFDAPGGAR